MTLLIYRFKDEFRFWYPRLPALWFSCDNQLLLISAVLVAGLWSDSFSVPVQSLDFQPPQITGASSLLFVYTQRPAGLLFMRVSVDCFVMLATRQPYLQQTVCLWFSTSTLRLSLSSPDLCSSEVPPLIYPIKSWEGGIASENSVARETAASK